MVISMRCVYGELRTVHWRLQGRQWRGRIAAAVPGAWQPTWRGRCEAAPVPQWTAHLEATPLPVGHIDRPQNTQHTLVCVFRLFVFSGALRRCTLQHAQQRDTFDGTFPCEESIPMSDITAGGTVADVLCSCSRCCSCCCCRASTLDSRYSSCACE